MKIDGDIHRLSLSNKKYPSEMCIVSVVQVSDPLRVTQNTVPHVCS